MNKEHHLKIAPKYFEEVRSRNKTFELRKNDRDFKAGDVVYLNEWTPDMGFSGNQEVFIIGYVLDLNQWFNGSDFVVFSLLEVENE